MIKHCVVFDLLSYSINMSSYVPLRIPYVTKGHEKISEIRQFCWTINALNRDIITGQTPIERFKHLALVLVLMVFGHELGVLTWNGSE